MTGFFGNFSNPNGDEKGVPLEDTLDFMVFHEVMNKKTVRDAEDKDEEDVDDDDEEDDPDEG